MPNWCTNTLTIYGGAKSIKEFKKKAYRKVVENNEIKEETDLSFEQFLPIPLEKKEDGWYDWCISNWGTKWDACSVCLEPSNKKTQLIYTFDTAWSPPCNIVTEMSKQFPSLLFHLHYDEPSMQFAGIFEIKNGR